MSEDREITPLDQAKAPFFVGIDLGGTGIKFGLVDDLGQTLAWEKIPTRVDEGPDNAVARMAETVKQIVERANLTDNDVSAIGLATPGTMDIPAGMLLQPVNLTGWNNYPIRDRVAEACDKQVAFANDANAAAYGEYWIGTGAEYESMILLTLGTGVGGGIIIGDLNLQGQHSHGSEVGHIIIDYNESARTCGDWGGRGHLEAYASATAVVKRARRLLEEGRGTAADTSIRTRLAAGCELTALLLHEEAERGDAFSMEVILEAAMYLGVGITSLMHTVDPDAIILGGAMTFGQNDNPIGQQFLARVKEEVNRRAFPTPAEQTVIDYASLGGDAGYLGAAGVARLLVRSKAS